MWSLVRPFLGGGGVHVLDSKSSSLPSLHASLSSRNVVQRKSLSQGAVLLLLLATNLGARALFLGYSEDTPAVVTTSTSEVEQVAAGGGSRGPLGRERVYPVSDRYQTSFTVSCPSCCVLSHGGFADSRHTCPIFGQSYLRSVMARLQV